MARSRRQSNLDVTPCKSATAETRAELRPSTRPRAQVVAFRCSGKRVLPIFLVSFVVPSLALKLKRE